MRRLYTTAVRAGIYFKKHRQLPQVKGFFTRQVTVKTRPVKCIDIDGEACPSRTPASISLAPEALKIMVPQGFRERTFG